MIIRQIEQAVEVWQALSAKMEVSGRIETALAPGGGPCFRVVIAAVGGWEKVGLVAGVARQFDVALAIKGDELLLG